MRKKGFYNAKKNTDVFTRCTGVRIKGSVFLSLSGVNDASRSLSKHNLAEAFCYDDLNRLIKVKVGNVSCTGINAANQDMQYNSLGSVIYKNGLGTYNYNSARPNAVSSTSDGNSFYYDANGNLKQDRDRQLTYTAFDVPSKIVRGSAQTQFFYGPDRERYKRVDTKDGVKTTTVYIGNIERIQHDGSNMIEWKRYASNEAVFTIITNNVFAIQNTRAQYILKDEQGSPDVITDDKNIRNIFERRRRPEGRVSG